MANPMSVRIEVLVDRVLMVQMPVCFQRLSRHTGPVRDRIGGGTRQRLHNAVFYNINGKEWWDANNPV
jgi:hypothetical protein